MSESTFIIRILKKFITALPYLVVVGVGVPVIGMASNEAAKVMGLRTVAVPVVGTGSMYPSLFWSKSEGGPEDESKAVIEEYRNTPHLYQRFGGINLFGKTYFRRQLGRGDMVAFKNSATSSILKTEEKDVNSGFIKRLIGIPGDTIELRDGFVYRNTELISEPYILYPRSTYGGESVKDCQKITLKDGEYFVLGDNRKISSDSRFELGLISEGDIQFVLPYTEQKIYERLWRDTKKDGELLGQPTLSSEEFASLLSTYRKSLGLSQLTLSPQLQKSTTLRGEKLLSNSQTDFKLKESLSLAGYSNIVVGEFVSYGHFSAKELLENILYNSGSAKQIIDKDYTDLGVSAVNRDINGCPSQVIVGHLGGYIPATYDRSTVDSWISLRDNLHTILPSWEKAMDYNGIDKGKLTELLTILRRRSSLADLVVDKMNKKEWLSKDEEQRIKADEYDANKAEMISKELNKE